MPNGRDASDIIERNKNRADYASYLELQARIQQGRLINIHPPPSSEHIKSVIQGVTTVTLPEYFAVQKNNALPATDLIIAQFSNVGITSWIVPEKTYSVEYLIVGGGGGSGGGFDNGGGGGGGGGQVTSGRLDVFPGNGYTIVVGDGGAGGISIRSPVSETNGSNGDDSSFGSIRAFGGGGGYASRKYIVIDGIPVGGLGGIPPTSTDPSRGGTGGGAGGGGGGGGGAGGSGTSKSGVGAQPTAGSGGTGVSSDLSGTSVTYGAGGNGANGSATSQSVAGTANTGNGARAGGGISATATEGAKGGSGIVILKYFM